MNTIASSCRTACGAVLLVLAACGPSSHPDQGSSASPEVSAAPAAVVDGTPAPDASVPATGVAVAPLAPSAPANPLPPGDTMIQSIHVGLQDPPRGIQAVINRVDAAGNVKEAVARTDKDGNATLSMSCKTADYFNAQPDVHAYLAGDPVPCAADLRLTVFAAQAMLAMIDSGDLLFTQGRYGEAQAAYALAAKRLRSGYGDRADYALNRANISAARALGVDKPSQLQPGAQVLDPETKLRIRKFQEESALPGTGVLDDATREALRRKPAAAVRPDAARATETPATPPSNDRVNATGARAGANYDAARQRQQQ